MVTGVTLVWPVSSGLQTGRGTMVDLDGYAQVLAADSRAAALHLE
jgi:hypothetical protein